MRSSRDRRPRRAHVIGQEPDYRFSLANERTFLAWIRTSLGLLAGGVALATLDVPVSRLEQGVGASALAGLGAACAGSAWWRWARVERAMRTAQPLPPPRVAVLLSAVVCVVGVVLAIRLA